MDMSHAANCLATLRKVEDISTSLATRNATFCCRCRLQKWGVTREIFLATLGKIASCNMALSCPVFEQLGPKEKTIFLSCFLYKSESPMNGPGSETVKIFLKNGDPPGSQRVNAFSHWL